MWSTGLSLQPLLTTQTPTISSRIDWSDLLAVQRTLKSLLQHLNLKASILQCSAFFMLQVSHLYMTTGNKIKICTVKAMVFPVVMYGELRVEP